jgi:RimJ/RimL family protein N-acetyltransferase
MIRYPKVFRADDGRAIVVRPATADDINPLLEFFTSLPEEDRLHLRVDVTQRDVMRRRMMPQPHWDVVRLIGIFGDRVVAECSIARRTYGFQSHVGEVRLLVAPAFRGAGLATYLGRQLIAHAIMMDVEKLEAAMMEDDVRSVRYAERLGFEREGVLKNFVKDIKGNRHNLLILSLST